MDLPPRLRQFVRRYYSSLTRLRFRGLFFVSPSSALKHSAAGGHRGGSTEIRSLHCLADNPPACGSSINQRLTTRRL
ncbi:hypothetical protein T06_17039 [Trichinella sp. T6]|nr:hypothetical protein T06_17039 [Trichinella sp. T6]